jgi:large subunit ribosomal protein L25
MEEKSALKAEIRENTGSAYARKVRKDRRIPAIVYGHKQEPVSVSLDAHDFTEGLHHGQRLMDIKLGRKKETVLVKDIQYDHLGKDIIHADLMRVSVTELVTVTVPIELKGVAKGTHEGGIVEEHVDHLEIECKVTDIPESIVVSVKELDVDEHIFVRDVQLPQNVTLVTEPDTLLVSCSVVAAAKTTEEVEAEEPVAPEVIGKEEKPEEEPQQKEEK